MLIDSHSHMYLSQFDEDVNEAMARCQANGVAAIFLPNIDLTSVDPLFDLCDLFPDRCYPMLGLHPCSVKEDCEAQLSGIQNRLTDRKIYAIGEIGLDYYWDLTFKDQQVHAFRTQISWAKNMSLPIVIHSRDSFDDVLKILEEEKDERLYGICHCFTGSVDQAKRAIDLGFLLGIGGVVTFKNAGLDKTLEHIDLTHLVLETDAPYLAPVPYRGKRNESSYITYIAEKLANIKNVPVREVAEVTTRNAHTVFGY